jgi:FkbM family methyltransferase
MSFISYAQNYEDVTLYRALRGVERGFYIDVGANDPINDSVTCAFYQRGWRGINLEPSAQWHARLQAERPEDINLQVAVSDAEGSAVLHDIPGTGMGTLVAEVAHGHQARGLPVASASVPTRTLSAVCEAHGVTEIHFLKIDVEGAEAAVLRGFDLRRWRPWVVVVEATAPNSTEQTHAAWEGLLTGQDYRFVYFDGLNRFYVATEHHAALAPALSLPPNLFDGIVRHADAQIHQRADALALAQAASQRAQAQTDHELTQTRHALAAERARAEQAHAEVAAARAQLEALQQSQQEVARLHEALAQERASTHRLHNRVAVLEHELHRTLQSLSWRLTEPLRQGKLQVSRLAGSALRAPRDSVVRRGGRALLSSGLAVARAVPAVKPLIARAASVHPALDAHLRGFARARRPGLPPPGNAVVHAPAPAAAPNALPWQAPVVGAAPDQVERALPAGERIVYCFVDHTHRCEVNTGVQRVTRGLGRELLARGERVVFVKWDPASRQLLLLDQAELAALARWSGPVLPPADLARHPRPGEPALCVPAHRPQDAHWLVVPEVTYLNFHGAPTTLDVLMAARTLGLRSAFVFYDAIPLRRDELRDVAPVHETYMQQLLLADLLLPISHFVGDDLRAFFQLHEAAGPGSLPLIQPLNLPGESMTGPRVTTPAQGGKLILSLGTIDPRKNQLALAEAFEQLLQRHPGCGWQLALVGNLHPAVAPRLTEITRRCPAVRLLAHLPDAEVAALFSDCAFTVFPSVEEGFGLPILESLWNGKPCVCANFGAMAEVAAGGGCLSTDTRDVAALSAAIEQLVTDPALLARLSAEALSRPIDTWADYGRKVSRALDEATDPRRSLGTVYYSIEHTCTHPGNTGIQRVVRGLARGLIERGVRLVPVRWSAERQAFHAPTEAELQHMAGWNGPPVAGWAHEPVPAAFEPQDWLMLPELTVYPGAPDLAQVKAWCARHGLRSAWVFYDAIPWKMRELYPPHWNDAHAAYMRALNQSELVLAISEFSRQDLIAFLQSVPERTPDLERRVLACPLPGEFREVARSTTLPAAHEGAVRILTVGSVEPRKNHLRLVEAFRAAAAASSAPMELWIAGGCHLPEAQAAAFRALVADTPGIHWEEAPNDTRLHQLYAQCDFTVYPSLEEGFGLPILESLWNARPCVCRNSGAMREVAEGGGCVMVDTASVPALTEALLQLTDDPALRERLAREAIARPVRTWQDYATDVITRLARERVVPPAPEPLPDPRAFAQTMVNLAPRPLLSICITTYNRAAWLALSLRNLARLMPQPVPGVEIVVCDNTSPDDTPEVVKPYLSRPDFRYQRNPRNVGMLGNLRETAHLARGRHVWILGDDDLIVPGAVQTVLATLQAHPELALVYLNYAYTREDRAEAITDLDRFLAEGTPIVTPGPNQLGPVHQISTASENFFTAIYCLVFRRDHALRAYSQDTSGRPFSSMLTAIPTTHHVLHHMMDEPACWIGQPQMVVNMNVSWLRYAPLWILERLPEVFDRAERLGASPAEVDRWREHNLPGVLHFWQALLTEDPEGNAEFFSPARVVARFKHLPAFGRAVPQLRALYEAAHAEGKPAAKVPVAEVFRAFPTQP